MKKLSLSGKWRMVGAGFDCYGNVPGSMYSFLLENKLIPDGWAIGENGKTSNDASHIIDCISGKTDGGILVYNPTGFERRVVLKNNGYTEIEQTVPSFGWTVVKNTNSASKVNVNGLNVDNEFYIVTLNEAGQIDRLYDKRVQRDVLCGKGNVLVAFEDYPTKYDAWEIEDYYKLCI